MSMLPQPARSGWPSRPVPAPRRARRADHGSAGPGQAARAAQPEARAPGADDGTGFSQALLDDAEAVLKRAGERLRLSGNHTVVALAGGTGSGKSTLFNALSGATFSPPGVTRPTTRHVHACVWGMQGAAPLLDWLGVQRRHRYARASVLDSGESDLDGLILLDLPDHDSVVTASMAAVDRLSKLADMVIWVLDPQKYADAAVHNRYLIPLAGHAAVFTVVLNQIDVLSPQQARDCGEDLRRLLDAEGLADTPLLGVSARTGARARRAARRCSWRRCGATATVTDRIAADIDALVGGFAAYSRPAGGAGRGPGRARPAPLAAPTAGRPARAGPSLPPWELDEDEQAEAIPAPAPSRPPWEDAAPDGEKREARRPGRQRPEEARGAARRARSRAPPACPRWRRPWRAAARRRRPGSPAGRPPGCSAPAATRSARCAR